MSSLVKTKKLKKMNYFLSGVNVLAGIDGFVDAELVLKKIIMNIE